MSVHLVGGGWQEEPDGAAFAAFVGDGGLRVAGHGSVWRALPAESGVLVSTIGA
ncbi:hypothetical protein [Agromyces bauzanensis]|uniref:Uncharacterized protein n=1 Tax=Agromyces bauzanensis TaxID=1308924 RepID=A0A917PCK2_9MICO|nr:hypothetical protein [Agromyces bauzanensis]GGJ70613.1 hypothetical protein GCM10011372_05650 [Agromyces bauzanensis]